MKLIDIERNLVNWYMMSAEDEGSSVYLTGPTGRGKTSVMRLAPALLDQTFVGKKHAICILNGACFTLSTATGYLWPVTENGKQYSRFTVPDWWLGTIDASGKKTGLPLEAFDGGIILVDEADKLEPQEKKIMGEAALSKRLASHDLPPGWVVWFAGNRAQDRSGSTKEFDHLIDRRMQINVDDDLESTIQHFEKIGCLPETIVFAQENPNIIFPEKVPDVQGPYCTPRGTVAVDKYLQLLMRVNDLDAIPTTAEVTEQIGGRIGAGAAAQFMASIRLGQELPSYEEIVAKPKTIAIPKRPDAMMLAIYKLAARVSKKDIGPVLDYVKRLPKEFAVNFARAATKRDITFINTQAFRQWCQENAALVSILNQLPVK